MSLDIKYRPRNYEDVLGQEDTISILKEIVRSGRGFQQSYLFCGGHGSGKTTLGRILARAMLCADPVEGAPCNQCPSCLSVLTDKSPDFVEVDAATNSGKADVIAIKDELAYSTFSGKRRIYLFDESHRMSKDALDALLKPLEDNIPGSQDKRLTCIFCTTEPEKMQVTILSRCAPAFVVQAGKPENIATLLARVCTSEGIEYDPKMLLAIASLKECHIRDALKAIEGVSMLGPVSEANVKSYLHLALNSAYIQVLNLIGADLRQALAVVRLIVGQVSPAVAYEKLASTAMLAFQVYLGDASVASYWDEKELKQLSQKGDALLAYAAQFANRPGRPSTAMLEMDVSTLHLGGTPVTRSAPMVQVASPVSAVPQMQQPQMQPQSQPTPVAEVKTTADSEMSDTSGIVSEQDRLWLVDQRLVNRRGAPLDTSKTRSAVMTASQFAEMLSKALIEMEASGRSP